jgi:hypothetical protein
MPSAIVISFLQFFNYPNPVNAELNPICHLPALFGAHHILHISRIRVQIGLKLNVTHVTGSYENPEVVRHRT